MQVNRRTIESVSRRTEHLRVDHLAKLPVAQRSCVFWELSPVDRSRLDVNERLGAKELWLSTVLREWGACGVIVEQDDCALAYATYAPAAWLPGAAALPTAPSSPDAVVLANFFVLPRARGQGLGRVLVQGVARDLVERGIVAIETYANPSTTSTCVLPVDFWGSVGFKTHRTHPSTPRMRMELRSAISWKDEVEEALVRVWGAVRPMKQPTARPIGRSVRTVGSGADLLGVGSDEVGKFLEQGRLRPRTGD